MTKTFRFIGMVLVAVLMGVGFANCSSGSDDADYTSSPEDNLPKASRAFLGYWEQISNYNNINNKEFFFFADGTCELTTNNGNFYEGYWTYNDTTRILATTCAGWQYQVTLSNSNSWAGVSLGSSSTNSFERVDSLPTVSYLLYGQSGTSWQTDTLTFKISDYHINDVGYLISGTMTDNLKTPNATYISLSGGKDSLGLFTFKYTLKYLYTSSRYKDIYKEDGSGTLVVENAFTYNKKKMRLTFTGRLTGTVAYKEDL